MEIYKPGLLGLLICLLSTSCNKIMYTEKNIDGTYNFETVENDPMNVKICTLSNGLKVYMSVNKDAPRIQTLIATRAGSKNDPSDATGLAHYLEHMLFKGSTKIGALDWEKEKILLKQISDLYEKHRESSLEDRATIYNEIDSISNIAAKYVVANEYDKLVSSLGAKGTNAFTSLDRTVYINDIPTNEIEKWLKLESERFSNLVLRLFHTELEAVYEEYNISLNNDRRKMFQAFLKGLLPNHPYGTQTTIGTGEHLKTPSMEKIHDYFNTYYVPNNMAIILSGDFDPDKMVSLVEKYWGKFKTKKVPKWKNKKLNPLTKAEIVNVYGKEKSSLQIGWRLPGIGTIESLKAQLIGGILFNKKAGLIDINLIQKQIIGQSSAAGCWSANDYSFFYIMGEPRAGQSLEAVKEFLFKELGRIKSGNFDDWLIDAVINNMEYKEIQSLESNSGRAFGMLDAFIGQVSWDDYCNKFKQLRAFSKQEIIDFANEMFKDDNCVIVYKREGEDNSIQQFNKPKITPVSVNRETSSQFSEDFQKMMSPDQEPLFLDYEKSIESKQLKTGVNLDYIKNVNNKTFELVYIIEMGLNNDNILPLALKYLKFLGTDKYSSEELQQEFFKLGLSFDVNTRSDVCYVTLTGLDRSFEKGVELFEHILANAQADEPALQKMINSIKKKRTDDKKDKRQILQRAMLSYGYYGNNSPFKARVSMKTLDVINSKDLMKRIKKLTNYEHAVFYYGSKTLEAVTKVLEKHHETPAQLLPVVPPHKFVQLPTDENKVVFVNFKGMVQAEILLISKGASNFNSNEDIISRLYNDYFGAGLASVVFQEIRESRALAYSTYVYNSSPDKKDKAHYLRAFVGTQADKIKEAIEALVKIIEDMPISEEQILNTAESIVKKIQTERVTGSDIYWNRRDNQLRGLDKDIREEVYKHYKHISQGKEIATKALKDFHSENIKGRKFVFLVLGDKENLDMEYLNSLGTFEALTLEEIFGY
ncbi:MAG: insulinase family protein [Saprospiraceae bacterium]|nr:insulinase family protein [Saprospiraceae bacterium]